MHSTLLDCLCDYLGNVPYILFYIMFFHCLLIRYYTLDIFSYDFIC